MPIKVFEIELTAGLKPIRVESDYDEIYALIRFRGHPLGWLNRMAPTPIISVGELRRALTEQLGHKLVPLILGAGFHPVDENHAVQTPISVIVCTRDRAEQLRDCLEALTAMDYENFEIIVVDNAPTNGTASQVAAHYPVRYVCEKNPGLDRARNRGIAEATHEIVAFTDDDARPDPGWLKAVARTFLESDVMAVTGMIAPAELETPAQVDFEINYGGMTHGFRRRHIHRDTLSDKQLLWASTFGVGANMAFRKQVFASIGLFDVALDVGTASGGGGDVEMLHRVVAGGFTLVYEPGALVWHTHRRDCSSLRRQLYQNGTGFGSYLLTCARKRCMSRRAIATFAIRHWLGGWILRRLLRRGNLPRRYVLNELHGALRSPFAYRAAQRCQKILESSPQKL
ncbi:MAG: glycosyl transferase family 2 [Verrucomicrobiales bacterium]|nr:glycosyl transferase family 2 [Verrucomicrobiales bacterium]